jgi:hypothetical protein
MDEQDRYLTPQEVCDLLPTLGLTVRALADWRHVGRGPVYSRLCGKIRYKLSRIREWERECEQVSTSTPLSKSKPRSQANAGV